MRRRGPEPAPKRALGFVAELEAVEVATGERPLTCPWRAFAEPDVAATLKAHDLWETGQCAEWWGSDPETWLVEAARFFHLQITAARADVDEILRNKPTGAAVQPPLPGTVKHRVTG